MGFEALLQPANFTLSPDATLNTEIHENSVRIKVPSLINTSKRKHKNQIENYDKNKYSWLIILCVRVNENQQLNHIKQKKKKKKKKKNQK